MKQVIVEIPEVWFDHFRNWMASVKISEIEPKYVLAVHRVYGCVEESFKEIHEDDKEEFDNE